MEVKLSIGVTQFLLLTAVCDRKINLATKLIYLFLSLALLLIPQKIPIFTTQFKDMSWSVGLVCLLACSI